jgi:hypothetical protein
MHTITAQEGLKLLLQTFLFSGLDRAAFINRLVIMPS